MPEKKWWIEVEEETLVMSERKWGIEVAEETLVMPERKKNASSLSADCITQLSGGSGKANHYVIFLP
jgi:hypothetical protein